MIISSFLPFTFNSRKIMMASLISSGARKPPAVPTRKSEIDEIILRIPGVTAKKIGGLDAYFVNDRMFACINGKGVGLRLPAANGLGHAIG